MIPPWQPPVPVQSGFACRACGNYLNQADPTEPCDECGTPPTPTATGDSTVPTTREVTP